MKSNRNTKIITAERNLQDLRIKEKIAIGRSTKGDFSVDLVKLHYQILDLQHEVDELHRINKNPFVRIARRVVRK